MPPPPASGNSTATQSSQLGGHCTCRWCGSSYSICISSLKFVDLPKIWVIFGHSVQRPCDLHLWSFDLLIKIATHDEKALGETQTLRVSCSKAEPKILDPPQTPFPAAGDGQNLISWRWSLPLHQFGENRCTQFRVIVVTDPQTATNP